MNARIRNTLASLLGVFALSLSAGALADSGRWHDDDRGWGQDKHYYKHHHKHHPHHAGAGYVIIREAPVVYERRVYYDRPSYRHYYDEPSVSFSFTVPLR